MHRLLDFIFPPRASERCVRGLSLKVVRRYYAPATYETVTYILEYQNEVVRSLIQENKYYNNLQASAFLATILDQWLTHHITGPLLLVPVPLSSKRRKQRGYNQVEEFLKQIPIRSDCFIQNDVLIRVKETSSQTTLKKSERLQNLKGAFIYNSDVKLYGVPTIVILDDVLTTGATLLAARSALAPHVPATTKIICLAVAH